MLNATAPNKLMTTARLAICGTSVGALHACHLAATLSQPRRQALALADTWRRLRVDRVLRFHGRDLWLLARSLARRPSSAGPRTSLVDARGLRALAARRIRWGAISRNIRAGRLTALSVTATRVSTGRPCVFVQGERPRGLPVESVSTRIRLRHALAVERLLDDDAAQAGFGRLRRHRGTVVAAGCGNNA